VNGPAPGHALPPESASGKSHSHTHLTVVRVIGYLAALLALMLDLRVHDQAA